MTYPGVYVEEVPSDPRTIVGVATSNTAFVDFFARGPVDEPVRVESFAGFERTFGGLDARSEASYGLLQYFRSGGRVAWVVRVCAGAATSRGHLLGGTPPRPALALQAANPGAWGNRLRIAVDGAVAANPDSGAVFTLLIGLAEQAQGAERVRVQEEFRDVSMDAADPRYVRTAVNRRSVLVRLPEPDPRAVVVMPHATAAGHVRDSAAAPPESFVALGVGEGNAGTDGTDPATPAWRSREGAVALAGNEAARSGLFALERVAPGDVNLLCLPAAAELDDPGPVYAQALAICRSLRMFLVMDIARSLTSVSAMQAAVATLTTDDHAAVYFPRLEMPDPLDQGRPRNVGASGAIAGTYARTDAERGVWKAPAGLEAVVLGASPALIPSPRGPDDLDDDGNGALNRLGVNAIRRFRDVGTVVWGARTRAGSDSGPSEWKYVPVRRTAMFIEESLHQGLRWTVFEPNDERLWAQIRSSVDAFMHALFRQGAFQGRKARDAYFVKCDGTTTTAADVGGGSVNVVVGFAPLKPAEFVVLRIRQVAGQVQP